MSKIKIFYEQVQFELLGFQESKEFRMMLRSLALLGGNYWENKIRLHIPM